MKRTKLPKSKAKNAYDLLTDVRACILEEPKRYNQRWWKSKKGKPTPLVVNEWPACGTVACVAGWAVTLKGKSVQPNHTEYAAAHLLGLTEGGLMDTEKSYELFASDCASTWGTPQTKGYARAGAAHIRRFQKKYAKQLKAKAV